MASIARKNLFEDIPRLLVAQAGIMFAVSLVTIQTGILNGFTRSTGILIDRSEADIWVANQDMVGLELTLPISAAFLQQAQQIEGVQRAEALLLSGGTWRSPQGKITSVRLFGFDSAGTLFKPFEVTQGNLAELKQPYTVITDATNLDSLDVTQVGEAATIGSLSVKLVGLTTDVQSIASGTFLFSSLENAKAYATGNRTANLNCRMQNEEFQCTNVYQQSAGANPASLQPMPLTSTDAISYVLIQAEPGQDLQELKQKLEAALPDTRAYTRNEMAARTRNYWVQRTGIGFILGLGATVGIIVGMVIVGQILYSSVADHLKEFATLKAMGVPDRVVYGIIIQQALLMSILGYIPSLGLCIGLGAWTFATQGITILVTPIAAAGIFGITVFMCVGSALFAIQKVTRVDPAIVFKS
ncbi:MAG: FtsX-like permease family protein [Drouetiella hepatica Uher 2000/2452]|jgi:putative ABC transport system permease protein|uniref:FtsX-like permease family protein n=1 Tax=Drouetiella hepatica Uher 2000/2452 TaxID=904376 RepID=A0A951Q7U7_9CYAN|nr:FtsX-like permease family protein [Drouetiella hepatica Uher 2000/2452]